MDFEDLEVKCDVLIIGAGIAGLSFALKVAKLGDVVILTKTKMADCATALAQGGIASVYVNMAYNRKQTEKLKRFENR